MSEDEIFLNKTLIQKYGLEETVLLALLMNKSCNADNGFEYSTEQIKVDINFSRRQQERGIKRLIELGFIEIKFQGMPAKRYFKLNYENLPDCLQGTQNKKSKHESRALIAFTEKPTKPKTNKIKDEFEQLWSQYPNKQGKQKAFIAYEKAVKSGTTFEDVMQGIQNYSFFIEQTRLDQQYVKHGSTWFNQHAWEDDYTVIQREPKPKDSVHEHNKRVFLDWLAKSESDENDNETCFDGLFGYFS